jgi:pimeloyl-ACP methyl ester carboxylesterase
MRYVLFLFAFIFSLSASAKTLIINDETWQIHDQGKGDVVLVLGGGPAFTVWNLLPLQQHIAQRHRAILFDMRGVGDQQGLILPTSALLSQWIEDIEAVRKALGVTQMTLVGHSWGGLMSLLYAKHYPKQVKKLVLLNPVDPEKRGLTDILDRINERQNQHKPQEWDANWDNDQTTLTKTEDEVKLYQIRQVLPTYFTDFAMGERYAAQFEAKDFYPDLNSRIWQEYDALPFTRTDALALSNKPLHFADCNDDLLMPENRDGLRAYFPKMKEKVFQQCAHFPWIEQPKRFYPWFNRALN